MIYKTVIGNTSSEFDIDNSSTQYVLEKGTVLTSSTDGITEDANWHLNTIRIDGTINATSTGETAILAKGSETRIAIGDSGILNGHNGIQAYGDYARITNSGQINATGFALLMSFADHSSFTNSGEMHGMIMVDRADKTNIVLTKDSVLTNSSNTIDIATDDGQTSHVTNYGKIDAGNNWGVYMRDGNDTLINRGTILGGITLGEGNDVFDNRGGHVNTWIRGEDGNDTYFLDTKLDIDESDKSGIDTIKSTISMSLSNDVLKDDEIENLVLLGTLNHNGVGNEISNTITGNSGKNVLLGLAGSDTILAGNGNDRLDGGVGFDTLTGGKGADTFVFKTDYDSDHVTDFQNGTDHFDLSAWSAVVSFADLKAHHLTVSGDDVVIKAGTDVLTIEHTAKSEIDASDFIF